VKLITGVNFINISRMRFMYKMLAPKITKLCFGFETFWCQIFVQKLARKTFMKLITVRLLERQERSGFRKQENSGRTEGIAKRIRHQFQRTNEAEVLKNDLA